ncbi:SGNH/GDSL hydrolase family protein [Victivallis sp. Marseille-Q1083]|uniref:SGNH/GDSL hydrolase family protein n=1 Tax=Victivallis sp. Marseille-Q1083 TaxID=2717288 RepID=UPI00158C295E|nr:SGNH/GDSL hydrolase family protein [Victivallis sp. Marseille-Q1083]
MKFHFAGVIPKIFSILLASGTITTTQAESPRDITEIDSNFKVATVGNLTVQYYNALEAPFVVEGFAWRTAPTAPLYRLPESFSVQEINEGALYLAHNTAGGAIRFRSDSPYIVLRSRLAYSADMNHMPRTGSAGFDLYCGAGADIRYRATAQPNPGQEVIETPLAWVESGKLYDWTLNLPLYGGADTIEIGIAPGSQILPPAPHKITAPILFYGSSITQGGCASRPGNAYPSLLCRALDAPQINLGFSGSGRGEIALAEAIGKLQLAAIVLDYDHNAPDEAHLRATHEPFFQAIRRQQPELPVIMVSKCDFAPGQEERRAIIRQTYENAVKAGDRNVWFIDGESLFGNEDRDACTVDGCHPNDLGFYRMYRTMLPVLQEALPAK